MIQLLFLWIAGSAGMLFIHGAGYIRFMHIIGRCPGYYKHDMDAVIDRINREYGKSGKFQVLLVPVIQAPAIFGLVHPKILMPGTDYTEEEIYFILKHEMLHHYHHDMLVKILCEILCIVFWWNPLAFLVRRLVARALEIRVDRCLTAGFGEREKISYLECIVKSMKAGKQADTGMMITFAAQKGGAMKKRFHYIWKNQNPKKERVVPMRKTASWKSILRTPVKTSLTFLLIAAASFALFSRVTDSAVTMREALNAKSFFHARAGLNTEVPDIFMHTIDVYSPDKSAAMSYGFMYEREDKPWLTKEKLKEFESLPGASLAANYRTAGLVEDYKRILEPNWYGGYAVFEADFGGYEDDKDNPSIVENHVQVKFDNVKVIAMENGPEIESSFVTEITPLGDMPYAKSPYTKAFYDNIKIGSRCIVLADNSGYTTNGSSGIRLNGPYGSQGAIRVIEGQGAHYLETEEFADFKGWVDAINHNLYTYDIEYNMDTRRLESTGWITKGRTLTEEDTDACIVSEDFLEEHGLSVGDRIHVQLGNQLCKSNSLASTSTSEGDFLNAEKIPEFVKTAELTIVGAYSEEYDKNAIYVPYALLPVELPKDYIPAPYELALFVEDADDIERFHEAVVKFAEKVDLDLEFYDKGWLDVKDNFGMGQTASLLTTALYILGAMLALVLAVYLYIGRNKKSYAIMRTLGVPSKPAGKSVVWPLAVLSMLAMPVGGFAGLCYAKDIAEKALAQMADSAPQEYVPDASVPIYVVILCLLSEFVFVALSTCFFLQKMRNTPPLELLQEGVVRVNAGKKEESAQETSSALAQIDMAKLSEAREWIPTGDYGPIRHVAAYIRRHMRRSIGKTAVSLTLAVVLAAGVGTLALARSSYQDAFYALGVKGMASNYAFSSVRAFMDSPLVKDFYCYESIGARVKGSGLDIPMTITNDPARNLDGDCTVDFAEGFDFSSFEGTAQICLVGEELARELNVSAGDEIGLLSGMLYTSFMAGENGEQYVENAYKPYKVIGVIASDDADLRKGIFTGIRSDLEKLFSIDFTISHCEFTLADNNRIEELDALLAEQRDNKYMTAPYASYLLDSGGLTDIERIRGLWESLFPIAVAAAVLIGVFGAFLVILQSAQEAAFLRILGVTKKRAQCMLVFEQITLCISGIILVAGGMALSSPRLFAGSLNTLAPCFALYFLGCICGAFAAAVQVTRGRVLELLQVKE